MQPEGSLPYSQQPACCVACNISLMMLNAVYRGLVIFCSQYSSASVVTINSGWLYECSNDCRLKEVDNEKHSKMHRYPPQTLLRRSEQGGWGGLEM